MLKCFIILTLYKHYTFVIQILTLLGTIKNHENFNWLLNKVKNPHGLNSITSKIKYIPRGTMLTLGKKNFYFCGGAFSIDKFMRTIYKSWWPQEILSKEECSVLISNSKI